MSEEHIRNRVCSKMSRIPSIVLCCLLVLAQGIVLDYYMAKLYAATWWAWIFGDVFVVTMFLFAFGLSWIHFKLPHRGQFHTRIGTLPLGYVTWLIYSCFLATKVAVIFQHVAGYLDEKNDAFGPNLCKLCLAATSVIFMLLVLGHHDKRNAERKHYIAELCSGVTLDILDSVEFLEILFTQESRLLLPFSYVHVIIGTSCINFILPTMSLAVLSKTANGNKPVSETMMSLFALVYILLVDVPFFVMRMILWHAHDMDISVFAVKNMIMIFLRVKTIYENASKKKNRHSRQNHEEDQADNKGESIELNDKSQV